jgi:hypothetical protein
MGQREKLVWDLLESAAAYRGIGNTLNNYAQLCDITPQDYQESRYYSNLLCEMQVLYVSSAVSIRGKKDAVYELSRQRIIEIADETLRRGPALNQKIKGWKLKEV